MFDSNRASSQGVQLYSGSPSSSPRPCISIRGDSPTLSSSLEGMSPSLWVIGGSELGGVSDGGGSFGVDCTGAVERKGYMTALMTYTLVCIYIYIYIYIYGIHIVCVCVYTLFMLCM